MATPPPTTVRVFTRGDDAGSSRSANRAIRHAHLHGVLRNASVMAPCLHAADAGQVFNGLGGLCVGLHATLTSEWDHPRWGPVSDPKRVRSLLDDDGCFPRDLDGLRRRGADPAEAVREIEAQLDRLCGLGLAPAYLDEHMGVGWVDGFRDAFRDLARRRGLIYQPELDQQRVPLPHAADHPDYLSDAAEAVAGLSHGDYLMIAHPCFDDAETRAIRSPRQSGEWIARDRAAQRVLFCDPAMVEAFAAPGVSAAAYTDLAS